jgi:hypothetical protein
MRRFGKKYSSRIHSFMHLQRAKIFFRRSAYRGRISLVCNLLVTGAEQKAHFQTPGDCALATKHWKNVCAPHPPLMKKYSTLHFL